MCGKSDASEVRKQGRSKRAAAKMNSQRPHRSARQKGEGGRAAGRGSRRIPLSVAKLAHRSRTSDRLNVSVPACRRCALAQPSIPGIQRNVPPTFASQNSSRMARIQTVLAPAGRDRRPPKSSGPESLGHPADAVYIPGKLIRGSMFALGDGPE